MTFTAALGASSTLPGVIAGRVRDGDGPGHARVWFPDTSSGWSWQDLPLAADADSAVTAATSDGAVTWLTGTSWRAGRTSPFVLRSTDRRSWTSAELGTASSRASLVPQAVTALGPSATVVGVDRHGQPVALRLPASGFQALPAPPGDREFGGFVGVAARGGTIVALATAAGRGQTDEAMVYRSGDGGRTWTVAAGPAAGPGGPQGVALQGDRFVVTGYTVSADSQAQPGAWSSLDGVTWTSETLPTLDRQRDGVSPSPGDDLWLSAPTAGAGSLVAPLILRSSLRFGVLARTPAGAWSLQGNSSNWVVPGADAHAAVNSDGTVLLAQSSDNTGRAATLTEAGGWAANTTTLGVNDPGVRWTRFLDAAAPVPQLIGQKRTVQTTPEGSWTRSSRLTGYTVTGNDVTDRAFDPAGSGDFTALVQATNPGGTTVTLGAALQADRVGAGTFTVHGSARPSRAAAWSPVTGFATTGVEDVNAVSWTGNTWLAVGQGRGTFDFSEPDSARVWTSDDALVWHQEAGPFAAAGKGSSSADGACALPGGDLLAVGTASEDAQQHPVAWRRTAGQWRRLEQGALGPYGAVSSCLSVPGLTLLQGTSRGRATVWRTSDGVTFSAATVGERGDSTGPVRAFAGGGYAAAGTVDSDGRTGAVVWLSRDAAHWTALQVPAAAALTGIDVSSNGRDLLLAADSPSNPELWALHDAAAHLPSR